MATDDGYTDHTPVFGGDHAVISASMKQVSGAPTTEYADYRMATMNEMKKLAANAAGFAAQVKASQAKRSPIKPIPVAKGSVPKRNK